MSSEPLSGIPRARYILGVFAFVLMGTLLRSVWLTADPPWHATVGIVWHDEGAWVHNARNKALWGEWRSDGWNPMFVAPVFTALEYVAFELFGVGTWQARLVPVVSGVATIVLIAAGLAASAGRRAALIGAALVATNYVLVMWNRAALMESTMTAFLVGSWAAYALARRRPAVAFLAGTAAVLAWFTKASAAFFVAALLFEAVATIVLAGIPALARRLKVGSPDPHELRAALWALGGFAAAALVCILLFVLPNWFEYRFYNWQMSVTRKPAYTVGAFVDRASWIPIVHDFFTRMWATTMLAGTALVLLLARWRSTIPAERLLVLWVVLGFAELVVHDSGNERRFVMFVPALCALSAVLLTQWNRLIASIVRERRPWLAIPVLLAIAYVVLGSLIRLAFIYQVRPGVRWSAAAAVAVVVAIIWQWTRFAEWLERQRLPARLVTAVVAVILAGDLGQYWQWGAQRTYKNYEASRRIGVALPPGTPVHGKLANGLSLENRIRPVFVGRGFGNYEDRLTRDDVQYILTYTAPRVGYEGSVILDVLDAYPNRSIIMTFDVAETATGHDRAALIHKFGTAPQPSSRTNGRAHD